MKFKLLILFLFPLLAFGQSNKLKWRQFEAPSITASAATSLTLTATTRHHTKTYVFSGGAAATWTLPAIGALTGVTIRIKNRGTAALTISRAGSDQLYDASALTSFIVLPGDSYDFQDDGTYWIVM